MSICPYMSGGTEIKSSDGLVANATLTPVFVDCQKNKCQLWITVYTTEGNRTEGCAKELAPQMHEGVLRV